MSRWPGDEVIGFSSRDADIRNSSDVQELVEQNRPDWIVLTAAYTDVDACESNRELAVAVNVDGALNVGKAAQGVGARLMFLSSYYVFDGTKSTPYKTDDARNAQSVYGKTKAEAEIRLLELNPEFCILRTSWLFGNGGRCFPDTILRLAASRGALDVVNDQRGCPTHAEDLAGTIIRLCRENASGVVHATNAGDCTWFEFATRIVAMAGMTAEVCPVSSEQMARPAPRPAYSVLSPESLHLCGMRMPSWQDALERYIKQRSSRN